MVIDEIVKKCTTILQHIAKSVSRVHRSNFQFFGKRVILLYQAENPLSDKKNGLAHLSDVNFKKTWLLLFYIKKTRLLLFYNSFPLGSVFERSS